MGWRYLFAGHEELVNRVIAFFTSKATNPVLFQDVVAKCQGNPLTANDPNRDTWLKMGRLSIQDFLHYESKFAQHKRGIPVVVVEAILDQMCKKAILFQESLFQFGNNKIYTLNEDLQAICTHDI